MFAAVVHDVSVTLAFALLLAVGKHRNLCVLAKLKRHQSFPPALFLSALSPDAVRTGR